MAHRVNLRARGAHLFTYSGRSVLVTDVRGRLRSEDPLGLFVDNTRILSQLEVLVDGRSPLPIAASPVGGGAFLSYEQMPANGEASRTSVHLETAHFVGEGMRTMLSVEAHGPEPVRLRLAIAVSADFADAQEAEKGRRQQSADIATSWDEDRRELTFTYCHPQLSRAVALRIERASAPVAWNDGQLSTVLELEPRVRTMFELTTEPIFDGVRAACTPRRSFVQRPSPLERLEAELLAHMPRLTTSNATVAKAWDTAIRDLASLRYGLREGPASASAGLPLYLQFFGRDSLTIGWQAVMANPRLLHDAMVANSAWRGTKIDDWLDEEPGKMIHQARAGPTSVLGIDPFIRYYGDWATPPDFLIMLGQYLAWTNDRETVRRLLPAARDCIAWCDRFGDPDRDGFLEYDTRSAKGVKNQGWKDSDDAIVDERGSIVPNPIATSELQAYWYAGLQQAAFVFGATGDVGYAGELIASARALKRRFNDAFWMPDLGAYALGLDPKKRQIRVISSNDGHLLASGIVPVERGAALASRLMRPDMFSGWGIRTLSAEHPAYDPFSYHRGSVWPVEQATIGFGFARYGCWSELNRLAAAVFQSTDLFIENRLPEVIGGIQRDVQHPHPGIYPDSCEPQGWSASAIVLLIQSLLAMVAVAPMRLLVIDPHLPAWLPDLRLEGVRVGRAQLDLQFVRDQHGRTRYHVTRRRGSIRVIRQPPPQAPGADPLGRLWFAAGSLVRS